MRDRERIKRVLELLRAVWHMYPEHRLGQLLDQLGGFDFYTPDDEVEQYLRQVLKTGLPMWIED